MKIANEWANYFPVRVTLFGGLRVQAGDCIMDDSFARSEKLSGLLAYLIVHADRNVPIGDLLDAVWRESDSDQPENALKMQIYRLRTLFKQAGLPFFRECIIAGRGCYRWNPEIPCETDVAAYEAACQAALNACLNAEQQPLLERAISLYGGAFLPGCHSQSWVEPLEAYYQQLYRLSVSALIRLLQARQLHAQISELCRKVILVDPYWEDVHYYFIQSCISQNNLTEAVSHYRYTRQLFEEKLGIALSAHLDALCQELKSSDTHTTAELTLIRNDLQEAGRIQGAYVCDYNLFRQIYRLQARIAARSGITMALVLITMKPAPDQNLVKPVLSKPMGHFFIFLQKYMRSTDLLAPYSLNQYVLLMPSVSAQDTQTAIERVLSLYRVAHPRDHVTIEYLTDWVDPPEQNGLEPFQA